MVGFFLNPNRRGQVDFSSRQKKYTSTPGPAPVAQEVSNHPPCVRHVGTRFGRRASQESPVWRQLKPITHARSTLHLAKGSIPARPGRRRLPRRSRILPALGDRNLLLPTAVESLCALKTSPPRINWLRIGPSCTLVSPS